MSGPFSPTVHPSSIPQQQLVEKINIFFPRLCMHSNEFTFIYCESFYSHCGRIKYSSVRQLDHSRTSAVLCKIPLRRTVNHNIEILNILQCDFLFYLKEWLCVRRDFKRWYSRRIIVYSKHEERIVKSTSFAWKIELNSISVELLDAC